LQKITDSLRAWMKSTLAERTTAALQQVETIAQAVQQTNQAVLVQGMDFGADGKVAKKIQDKLKTLCPALSVFLCSIDDDNEKVSMYFTVTADHLARGLDAKKWCDHCLEALGGGKGGGRNVQATGTVVVPNGANGDEFIRQVVDVAQGFVAGLNI